MPARIVLDTNVLFAGLYSSRGASFQVLRKLEAGKIRLSLSTALVFEYEEVLRRNKETLELSIKEIDAVLDGVCRMSDHYPTYFLWRPFLPDPKDDHVLELAVASGTSLIVTHNVKDFSGAHQFGVQPITPKTLLEDDV